MTDADTAIDWNAKPGPDSASNTAIYPSREILGVQSTRSTATMASGAVTATEIIPTNHAKK
jgi:hypothetical protein